MSEYFTSHWLRTTPKWKMLIIRLLGKKYSVVTKDCEIISYILFGSKYIDRMNIRDIDRMNIRGHHE